MTKDELFEKHPDYAKELGIGSPGSRKKPDKKKRSGKYNATPTETKHGRFDSKGEAKDYEFLLAEQKAGLIVGLSRQITFPFFVRDESGNSQRVGSTRVDFAFFRVMWRMYRDLETDKPVKVKFLRYVVRDYKGKRTPGQTQKENLWKQCYPYIPMEISGRNAK